MTKKIRKILIFVLVCVFTVTLVCLAATNARYVSSPSPTNATNELVYTLSDQCVVKNQEELQSAIKNETNNIKLGGEEGTPFYVNTEDLELAADLILDLNGHEVMCITRDPILTVGMDGTTSLRLLVTDTSTSQTGSFYNPVGSVLSVEGGIVTTSGGKYESGPRKSEYYSNYSSTDYTGGTIANVMSVSVTYQRDSSGSTPSSSPQQQMMPIITPNTSSGVVTGNIYFDTAYDAGSGNVIPADTYFYFISTDFESSPTLANPSKADFYYTYYIKEDASEKSGYKLYTIESEAEAAGASAVVVCGYYNDKTVASDENSTLNTNVLGRAVSNFAAIKMQYGDIYVRGGNFYSWFGKSTAYCISATGASSTYDSDTAVYDGYFEAIEEGVCVRCSYQNKAPTLAVYGGDFYSYKGDMVQIEKGTMTVSGGTFTKDTTDTKYNTTYSTAQTAGANNSAIYINGGTMTVTGTADAPVEINLYGPAMDGIKCRNYNDSTAADDAGSITAEYAVFTYNDGSAVTSTYGYNVGIANYGGTVDVTSCLFDTNDSDSIGIKSESGTLTASGCNFVLSGEDATGIKADGGTVSIGDADNVSNTICMFYIDHVYNCYGIYSETSSLVTLNINAAQFIMGQGYYTTETSYNGASGSGDYSAGTFVSAGIYMNATATGSAINLKRAVFMMAGNYSAGVYAEAGSITQDDGSNSYTTALLIGVTHAAYKGNGLYDSDYTGNPSTNFHETRFGNSYFVAMYGEGTGNGTYTAAASFSSGNSLNALSSQFTGLSATGTAIGSYGIYSGGGTIEVDKAYIALCSTYGSGIYTEGGTMTIADFECDVRSTDSTAATYPGTTTSTDVSSSAIASGTGGTNASITITESNINTDAFGYNVQSGTLIFAGDSSVTEDNTLNSVRATAIYINGASLTINADAELILTSTIATSDGWTDPGGDLLTEYSTSSDSAVSINPDGIYVNGGSFTSNGTLNVTFAGVNNDTSVTDYVNYSIKSYAVRIVGDTNTAQNIVVTLTNGTVASSIGGGVYVNNSSSYSAAVTLGVTNADNNNLKVQVNGLGTATDVKTLYNAITLQSTWQYYLYTQSGHAIKVDNGSLTVNSGTYTVASTSNGNAVYVNGISSSATINGGVFQGYTYWGASSVGPCASYSLKVLGGDVTVTGGTFDTTQGNCMFIMGSSSTQSEYSKAYLYGGSFVSSTGRSVASLGYADMIIGESTGSTGPTITGSTYGLGIEAFNNENATDDQHYAGTVVLNSGTISASSDAIWYGNKNITLTINGGIVTSTGRNGICAFANYNNYLTYVSTSGIYINGGTINGGTSSYGICIGYTNFVMTGGTINGGSHGIYTCNSGNYYPEAHITISGGTVYSNTGSALRPGATGTATIRLSGCTFYCSTSQSAANAGWGENSACDTLMSNFVTGNPSITYYYRKNNTNTYTTVAYNTYSQQQTGWNAKQYTFNNVFCYGMQNSADSCWKVVIGA